MAQDGKVEMQVKFRESIPQHNLLAAFVNRVRTCKKNSQKITGVCLYGAQGSGKREVAKQLVVACGSLKTYNLRADTLFQDEHPLKFVHSQFNDARARLSQDQAVAIIVEDCEVLFHTNLQNFTTITTMANQHHPQMQQLNVLPNVLHQEIRATQEYCNEKEEYKAGTHCIIIFCTSNPSTFPQILMDGVITSTIYIPFSSKEERANFIITCLEQQEAIKSLSSMSDLIKKLEDCSACASNQRVQDMIESFNSLVQTSMPNVPVQDIADQFEQWFVSAVGSTLASEQNSQCLNYLNSRTPKLKVQALQPKKKIEEPVAQGDDEVEAKQKEEMTPVAAPPVITPDDEDAPMVFNNGPGDERLEEDGDLINEEAVEAPPTKKRKRNEEEKSNLPSPATPVPAESAASRPFKSFTGALAYAILKGKIWSTGTLEGQMDIGINEKR